MAMEAASPKSVGQAGCLEIQLTVDTGTEPKGILEAEFFLP